MKLLAFPNILRMFQEIYSDQPYPNGITGSPKVSATVPVKWVARFEQCEKLLVQLGEKTIAEIGAKLSAEEFTEQNMQVQEAWRTLALPCNEDDVIVCKAAGFTDDETNLVRSIMCEWFDGNDFEGLKRK
jgi:hypothetical protein